MNNVIAFPAPSDTVDLTVLRANTRKLQYGLIAPSVEDTKTELAAEHAAEPIKDIHDIFRISEYLIQKKRYRDNMIFILGINFGLRVSDLRSLRFSDLISEDFSFKEKFGILEKKTRNTRKHKKNRYVTINTAVIEAVTLYLENTPGVKLSDFLFRSQSNRGSSKNVPLTRKSIDRIMKNIGEELDLDIKMSTHTLRKTFAYHQMAMCDNDPRKLMLLQKMFKHSSESMTLDYVGLTGEEIEEAYQSLNLGGKDCYSLRRGVAITEPALA